MRQLKVILICISIVSSIYIIGMLHSSVYTTTVDTNSNQSSSNESPASGDNVHAGSESEQYEQQCARLPMNFNPDWNPYAEINYLPNHEYMRKGYHHIFGNPRPLYEDQGWRSTMLFQAPGVSPTRSYSSYYVPYNMSFRMIPYCSGEVTSESTDSMKSYLAQLKGESSTEITTDGLFKRLSGSNENSKEAKDLQEQLSKNSSYIVTYKTDCTIYKLTWDTNANLMVTGSDREASGGYRVGSGDDFVDDVLFMINGNTGISIDEIPEWCGPSTGVMALYPRPSLPCFRWFFEKWGTMWPESITFGGREFATHVYSKKSAASRGVTESTIKSYAESAKFASSSSAASQSLKKLEQRLALSAMSSYSISNRLGGVNYECPSMWNAALITNPYPVHIQWQPISQLLSSRFFPGSPTGGSAQSTASFQKLLQQFQKKTFVAILSLCEEYKKNMIDTLRPWCDSEILQAKDLLLLGSYQTDSFKQSNVGNYFTKTGYTCPDGYTAVPNMKYMSPTSQTAILYLCVKSDIVSSTGSLNMTLAQTKYKLEDFGGFYMDPVGVTCDSPTTNCVGVNPLTDGFNCPENLTGIPMGSVQNLSGKAVTVYGCLPPLPETGCVVPSPAPTTKPTSSSWKLKPSTPVVTLAVYCSSTKTTASSGWDTSYWLQCSNSLVSGLTRDANTTLAGITSLQCTIPCASSKQSSTALALKCQQVDFAFQFRGFVTCPTNYFLQGLYANPADKNGVNDFSTVSKAKCCSVNNGFWANCKWLDWWSAFDVAGVHDVNTGYFVTGFYTTDYFNIYFLEEPMICNIGQSTPAPAPATNVDAVPCNTSTNYIISSGWTSNNWLICQPQMIAYGFNRTSASSLSGHTGLYCTTPCQSSGNMIPLALVCNEIDWVFINIGYVTCPENQFLQGIYGVNSGGDLTSVTKAKCCSTPTGYWANCKTYDWFASSANTLIAGSLYLGFFLTGFLVQNNGISNVHAAMTCSVLTSTTAPAPPSNAIAKVCDSLTVINSNSWTSNHWLICPDQMIASGLTRSSANTLSGLTSITCTTVCPSSGNMMPLAFVCNELTWTFLKEGYVACPENQFLQGIYGENTGGGLDAVTKAKCCSTPNGYWANCKWLDWWSPFDNSGSHNLDMGYFLAGFFTSEIDFLYDIEEPLACNLFISASTQAPPLYQNAVYCYSAAVTSYGWTSDNWLQCPSVSLVTGLVRDSGILMKDLTNFKCYSPCEMSSNAAPVALTCSTINTSVSQGFVSCPVDSYLQGVHSTNIGGNISTLSMIKCCKATYDGLKAYWMACTRLNWWSPFDYASTNNVNTNTFITGFYLSDNSNLEDLEVVVACRMEYRNSQIPCRESYIDRLYGGFYDHPSSSVTAASTCFGNACQNNDETLSSSCGPSFKKYAIATTLDTISKGESIIWGCLPDVAI